MRPYKLLIVLFIGLFGINVCASTEDPYISKEEAFEEGYDLRSRLIMTLDKDNKIVYIMVTIGQKGLVEYNDVTDIFAPRC